MAYEVFANDLNPPSSTLAVAVTTVGQTSVQVTSAANFSTIPNFRIRIGNEIMLVTAVAGAVFTVTRGVEGTTASTYSIGANVDQLLTAGAVQQVQQANPQFTNTTSFVYTFDVTNSNLPDVIVWHGRAGNTAYVLPSPTQGRKLRWIDKTYAIQTSTNWVSFVPNAGEKINGSTGFAMTGTAYHFTNGSTAVSCTGGKFLSELYVGASIASSNQAGVNYIVASITNDTNLVLNSNFTGVTTTTATATRTSLLVAANGVEMTIDSDGTDWSIAGDGTPTIISFTVAGTFIGPAGTSGGTAYLAGGGGGGGGGQPGVAGTLANVSGGGGGGGSQEVVKEVSWTANTGLAVTVGAGGTGNPTGSNGNVGGASSLGSLATALGASGGGGGAVNTAGSDVLIGGAPYTAGVGATNIFASNSLLFAASGLSLVAAQGGLLDQVSAGSPSTFGVVNGGLPGNGGDGGLTNNAGGTANSGNAGNAASNAGSGAAGNGGGGGGNASGTRAGGTGGGGGGAGAAGQGGGWGGGGGVTNTTTHGTNGAGGSGANAGSGGVTGASGTGGAGGAGGNANANSGAGGGGGGGGGNGSSAGGAGGTGGNGGSGYVKVKYVL